MPIKHQVFVVAMILISSIAGGVYAGSFLVGIAIAAALVTVTHKPQLA